MARAAVSKKLTQKPKTIRPKLTRSAVKSIDDKYYGSEPIDISNVGYTNALNWYNYMYEQDQAREWLLEYLKKNKTKSELAAVRRLPKHAIPTTVGWIARILMNGNKLESLNYFEKRTAELIQNGLKTKEVSEVKVDKPVVSIQERTQAKINQLITECEEAIDNDSELNIYEWLKGKEATVQAANAIREFYSGWVDDFEPDEFDSRAQKKAKAEQKKYWEAFIADCDRYVGNKKATKVRKPREKKTKSAVDQVAKLQYQKEFPQLKIVSVNPAEIIGCNQLWVYNTKYKKLTQYISMSPQGLQIKGTTLTGWDPEQSVSKGLRKPDIAIGELLKAGKVSLRSFMTDLKTNETKPNGRINNDTVLLRVIK
jgi:hypothetical protein